MPRTSKQSHRRRSNKENDSRQETAPNTSRERNSKSTSSRRTSSRVSKITTDHDEIRRWAEERGGKPACVAGTGGGEDTGMIRIAFPGKPNSRDESLREISWDEFFDKFDKSRLALVYEDETAGGQKSNFNKLVRRDQEQAGPRRSSRHRTRTRTAA